MRAAAELLTRASGDSYGRLKWKVLTELGICPLSLPGRLTSRRAILRAACGLILSQERYDSTLCFDRTENDSFDPARFAALRGLEDR